MLELTLIQKIAVGIIPVLFAITVHEVAHGWVAYRLGDPTAKMLGRLTLNPIKHIDLVGTIIVPLLLLSMGGFIFGWAKPVPINWRNLKNKRRDIIFVSISGPLTNGLMALFWAAIYQLIAHSHQAPTDEIMALFLMSQIGILVNAVLMVLNLIPIPPLDGSRVLSAFLPGRWSYHFDRIEPYGFFILIILFYLGILSAIMDPLVFGFANLLM